ncbi:hypothetical protein OIV83_005246 [Microbotryomycetes sp. JL201]|nr:hypothetical protein OIV83_005246 [Microbotryomycetes sp. JL201]
MATQAGARSIPRVYLVSKRIDPLLGIFTGIWAYALYERRLQRPAGHSLVELIQWKWSGRTWFRRKPVANSTAAEDEEWAAELAKELQEQPSK